MRRINQAFFNLLLIACVSAASYAQSALGPGFNYQGKLESNDQPVNGTVNLRFSLWDAAGSGSPPTGGNQIGSTQQLTNVPIADGLFTVTLNGSNQFGATPFNGQSRFLQIEVCSDSTCTSRTTLSPRQPLTVAPYAAFAAAPWTTTGNNLVYTAGNVSIGTGATGAGLHIRHEPTTSSGTLALEGTSYTYLSFFPDGFGSGRKGYIGFPCSTCNDISITNEIAGGKIILAGGSGENAHVAQRLTIDATAETVPMIQLNGVVADQIRFGISGHTRAGYISYDDRFLIGNDSAENRAAWLQDDGSWSAVSDARMKTEIGSADGLLAKALALRPVEFYMIGQDCTHEPYKYLGLVAQEVQPILPSLVHANEKDDLLTMSYDRIGVVAIGAIQEQQQIIRDQSLTISEQERRILDLNRRLERQQSQIDELKAMLERLCP